MTLSFACADAASAAPTTATADLRPPVPAYLVPDELPEWLKTLESAGEFAKAEARLDELAAKGTAEGVADPAMERERLRRIRRDYSLTEAEMRTRLRRALPEAGDAEFDRWRDEGAFQRLILDGEVRYFSRAASAVLLSHPPARALKKAADDRKKGASATSATASAGSDPSGRSTAEFSTKDYILRAVAAARASGTSEPLPVRFKVRHRITVEADAVPAGQVVRCWMPLAKPYGRQSAAADLVTTPALSYEAPPDAPQRTVYNEKTAAAGEPTVFEAAWTYRSAAAVPKVDPALIQPTDAASPLLKEHLAETAPHVLFTPEIRRMAQEIVGDETNPYLKARRIYSWIQKNVDWCPEMEYSTIANIVEKVSTERRGDCGTQALLFVTLARASGVPARWQSGWVTRPGEDGWNMHDWAEMHVAPYGWLTVDPSLSARFRDETDDDLRLFFFGSCDGYRMIASTDHSRPFDPPKKHWRSDPVDNQRGEVEWTGGNLYYDKWKYEVEVTSEEETAAPK